MLIFFVCSLLKSFWLSLLSTVNKPALLAQNLHLSVVRQCLLLPWLPERAHIPFVSLDREVSFLTRGGSGEIVAPPRALRERLTRRAQVRSKMAYRRLKDTGRLMLTPQEDDLSLR